MPTSSHMIQLVNTFHSAAESYRQRWLGPSLRESIASLPVVVLTGARQVGKSTLLRTEPPFSDWRYITFDDPDAVRQAEVDPSELWYGRDAIVLDEVQRLPEILRAVKRAVDEDGSLRFVLSGSANLLLMQAVGESLAGRAVYHVLQPLTLGEIERRPMPSTLGDLLDGRFPAEGSLDSEIDVERLVLRGFMPRLVDVDDPATWVRWWEGYVATYLERDLRQIARIDALIDFRRVMQLVASRSAHILNQSEVARDARLSQPTIHRYLNLLETTHLFSRVPFYSGSPTSRLVKAPRAFYSDPGLAAHLSGLFDTESMTAGGMAGALFETLVLHHLRVLAELMTPSARITTWRTRTGVEVDFVIEHGRRVVAIEVKRTSQPGFRHTEGLRRFLDVHEGAHGALIHGGREIRQVSDRLVMIPWTMVAG